MRAIVFCMIQLRENFSPLFHFTQIRWYCVTNSQNECDDELKQFFEAFGKNKWIEEKQASCIVLPRVCMTHLVVHCLFQVLYVSRANLNRLHAGLTRYTYVKHLSLMYAIVGSRVQAFLLRFHFFHFASEKSEANMCVSVWSECVRFTHTHTNARVERRRRTKRMYTGVCHTSSSHYIRCVRAAAVVLLERVFAKCVLVRDVDVRSAQQIEKKRLTRLVH